MNYKINIPLIVSPYSKVIPGGIGTWTKNMIDYYESDNRNYCFNILIYENQLKNITNTQSFTRIITGIVLYSRLFFQVLFLLRKYKPSVLHITSSASFGLVKDIMLIWLSKLMKIPVIMHWRFGRIPTLAIQRNWEWKILCNVIRESYACIVIDEKSYDTLLKTGLANVINIPNPIGLWVEQESKKLLNTPNQRLLGRILYVGHIVRNKGVIELVKACSQLPSIKELLLIGPCEEALKKELIKLAGVRENGVWLKLPGTLNKEQVLDQMHKSPILALPSYTEGFPNVVLEAMIMGCAVIATDVGAIPEMLAIKTESPCGICIPTKNVERLRDAILDLCNDPTNTETIGKNGIDRVLQN
jgi:glycosyltransferase involved in cell wall biosynthesis